MQSRTTNFELMVGGKYRFLEDFEAGLGVGPGLTAGVGTPDVRLVWSLGYTPKQELETGPGDRDGDGILDDKDACPDLPGLPNPDPKKNGCPPPPDTDGDGIIDVEARAAQRCRALPAWIRAKNGCPLPKDSDGDGIFDNEDTSRPYRACPARIRRRMAARHPKIPTATASSTPRTRAPTYQASNEDPTKNGCPPPKDTDGDGIVDNQDASARKG